jgi:PHS family inorganic phosphate transporter-like MFS transporter
MQGIGILLVPIVGMIFLYGFGSFESRHNADKGMPGIAWRLILGIGALPGLMLMPFQTCVHDMSVSSVSSSPALGAQANRLSLSSALRNPRYWRKLIGCAGGWFLFDITFYGNTLFAPTILKEVFHSSAAGGLTPTIGGTLQSNLCLQLTMLALLGLPGYYMSVLLMDSVGRKNIQVQGFIFMAILYACLGFFLKQLKESAAVLLITYGMTYFFSNFGPNSTTFLLPAESFPPEVRSSLNGFCAAMGKLGATVGSASFKTVVNNFGSGTTFICCAVCALLGLVVTLLCVEDRRGRDMASGNSFALNIDDDDCGGRSQYQHQQRLA